MCYPKIRILYFREYFSLFNQRITLDQDIQYKCFKSNRYMRDKESIILEIKSNNIKIDGQIITDVLTVNGIRFSFQDGSWGLIRASSNKPSLVVVTESPTSIKMLKFAMNLTDDGMVGQQVFAGEATRLAYMTDEAKEGRDAFLEKRKPNFDKKWLP